MDPRNWIGIKENQQELLHLVIPDGQYSIQRNADIMHWHQAIYPFWHSGRLVQPKQVIWKNFLYICHLNVQMLISPICRYHGQWYRAFVLFCRVFNTSWSSDALGRRGSVSTLVHVMACFLTALRHYRTNVDLSSFRFSDRHMEAIFVEISQSLLIIKFSLKFAVVIIWNFIIISQGPINLFILPALYSFAVLECTGLQQHRACIPNDKNNYMKQQMALTDCWYRYYNWMVLL